jgi:hypothetical protein
MEEKIIDIDYEMNFLQAEIQYEEKKGNDQHRLITLKAERGEMIRIRNAILEATDESKVFTEDGFQVVRLEKFLRSLGIKKTSGLGTGLPKEKPSEYTLEKEKTLRPEETPTETLIEQAEAETKKLTERII